VLEPIGWVAVAGAGVCIGITLFQLARHRDEPADIAVPLAFALAFGIVAAVCAAVADKVPDASARTPSAQHDTRSYDYPVSISVPDDEGFKGDTATLHAGPLTTKLCVFNYFNRGHSVDPPERSWKFWVRCDEAAKLTSIDEVRSALALPPRFGGARDARARAVVPAGTYVTYLTGTAAKQTGADGTAYPGGGPQIRFLGFEHAWLRQVRCLANRDESKRSEWVECERRSGDAPDLTDVGRG
jgi:hypothetical protein